jgi:hypothetical protein
MKKGKFRFSSVVLAPLAIATLAATATVAQAMPPTAVSDSHLDNSGESNVAYRID